MTFSFFITSFYTANLKSHLSLPKFPSRPETIKDLLNTDQKVSTHEVIQSLLIYTGNPEYIRLANRIEKPDGADIFMEKNFESFMKGEIAYIGVTSTVLFLQFLYNIGRFTYVFEEKIYHLYSCFPFHMHSPLTRPYTKTMNRLIETGLYSQIKKKHTGPTNQESFSFDEISSFSLSHLQAPFYILFGGFGISIFVFACEVLYVKKRRNNVGN